MAEQALTFLGGRPLDGHLDTDDGILVMIGQKVQARRLAFDTTQSDLAVPGYHATASS